jgi:hypothetical protein
MIASSGVIRFGPNHHSERFEILLILALGKPVEKVIIDEIRDGM